MLLKARRIYLKARRITRKLRRNYRKACLTFRKAWRILRKARRSFRKACRSFRMAQAAQIYGLTDMIQQKLDMPTVEADTAGSVMAVDLLNLNVTNPP